MKLLTWNVNHRTDEKPIPPPMAEAIISLKPDIIVLNEYVPGTSRENFLSDLKSNGFLDIKISPGPTGQNHILIAARTPLIEGEIKAPVIKVTNSRGKDQEATALPSNVFHVKVDDPGFDILGIRVPDYSKQSKIRNACWNWILETTHKIKNDPFVILGDFNVDPSSSPAYYRNCLDRLINDGWQHALPEMGASYWTVRGGKEKKLDHIFLSRHFSFRQPEYITESGQYVFAKKPGAMSDHAVLVVDAELKK
jgi:endonuclease/exonuclease/phosphatase family metal-dependent hydrolase